tara:strand:+ start:43 stop:315 length:273 start_codon:yes stop_codon:yes gene_type:complete
MDHKEKYIADIFKSIGHPIRLKIIRLIYEHQTLSVTDLQQLLKISQPVISLHLGILKSKNIINLNKKGKHSFYFIEKSSIPQVIQILFYD